MILTKSVKISWNNANKKIYVKKGYTFTKIHDKFSIPLSDLSHGSNVRISIECDYCKSIYEKSYKDYNKNKFNTDISDDCCKKCWNSKAEKVISEKYGVENISQSAENRVKVKATLMKNYGVDSPLRSSEIISKIKQTNKRNYGVEWVSHRPDIRRKAEITTLERHGVIGMLEKKSVKAKADETIRIKYGVNSMFSLKEIREKSRKTMYENSSAPCSKQQKHVHDILGGELNYPISTLSLDIAFPDKMMYIECDFRGHDLHVRLGHLTKEEMDTRETKRYHFLKDKGWNMVRIVSKNDKVPADETLLYMSEVYESHFRNGHSWITFDLDEGLVKTSQEERTFDYGKLKRIC